MKMTRNNSLSGSTLITPPPAPHPASDYQNTCKGWLRKQNRGNKINMLKRKKNEFFTFAFGLFQDSLFKRIERYYVVLLKDQLMLYKNESDQRAAKVINLRGKSIRNHLLNKNKIFI